MRQETRSRFSARLHKSTATAPPRDRPKTKILLVSTSGRDLKGIALIHTFPVSQMKWEAHQVSLSPTFYEQLLRQNPFTKKLQTQIVSTEKLHKKLSKLLYEKGCG
jgi:hypothetical protein